MQTESRPSPRYRESTKSMGSPRRFALAMLLAVGLLGGAAACSSDEPAATPPPASPTLPTIKVAASGENEAFCNEYADVTRDFLAAGSLADPELVKAKMADLKVRYAKLANAAPETVKADIALSNETVQGLNTPQELLLLSGEAREASDRVVSYVALNCGFDPNNLS